MNSGITGPAFSVVVSPVDPNTAFASAADGLHVTRDGGLHWQQVASTVGNRLIADPIDGRTVVCDRCRPG
jgi:hypothetical protein